MDELDQYGPPVRRYEGMGQLQFHDGSTSPIFSEARQIEDSGIVIGCLAPSGTLGLEPEALSGFTTADVIHHGRFTELDPQPGQVQWEGR
jgi:hypothetical protein